MIEPRSLRTAVPTTGWDMPSSSVPPAFWTFLARTDRMLLETIEFRGPASSNSILQALAFLRRRDGKREVPMDQAPLALVTKN